MPQYAAVLAYAAGAQEGRQPTVFHPLIFTPFPLDGRGFFLPHGRALRAMYPHIRRVGYRAATHMVSSTQAQHNSVAQRFYWVAVHGTVGVNWKKSVSVQSTPGDSVPLRGSCAPDRWC